jgi:hypothetical protein
LRRETVDNMAIFGPHTSEKDPVIVQIVELIPNKERKGWHVQKLSCGHKGNIRIMEPIEEKIEIKDEVNAIPINSKYGQTYSEKTTKDSRSILCKN